MVEKLKVENVVHGIFELQDDFTMCTIAQTEVNGFPTTEKINCEDCIRVIRFYKSVSPKEIKK
jgi:hypothetical protein